MTLKKHLPNRYQIVSGVCLAAAGWLFFNTAPKLLVVLERAEILTPKLSSPPTRMEVIREQAFLDTLATAEVGTVDPEGYRRIVFRGKVKNFARHPRKLECGIIGGKRVCSTAAGRYQALDITWSRIAAKLKLRDFSPKSQDKFAIELIREKRALRDVRAGRFDRAICKVGGVWASLPCNTYRQNPRSLSALRKIYNQRVEFYLNFYRRRGQEVR
ncbi:MULTISPECIES: glycoside hydrolase family 24 protein [Cyanophyceae]|uniref:glycoside hydrolase family 24 protein n=1 Tax=Cyanophyceae TaxID=3028117 RepID=UPI001681F32B|nr:glycoside hydrolase family 104 protein [Trichocoleus sp. FACHB-40]MBD2006346.1 glycoside hydrolase family 104 protein [Trichocoleus sp. FACHB-40]